MAETHAELVALAARWLRGTRKCAVVATERRAWLAWESPDAIGWMPNGRSILVEAEASVADFLADQRKGRAEPVWRDHATGGPVVGRMGQERWYLTPRGLLDGRTLPFGWGWLEVRGDRVHRRVAAVPLGARSDSEVVLLVAITRNALGGWRGPGVTVGDGDVEAVPDALEDSK